MPFINRKSKVRNHPLNGFYVGGAVGGHHDHRHSHRVVASRGTSGAGGGEGKLQCTNNLKQMGLGCLNHEQTHGTFPTGGWGHGWAGDASRGFDKRQPGGWHYNILPYMEMQTLHDVGAYKTALADIPVRIATPVATFICPSRRFVIPYPYPLRDNTDSNFHLLSVQPQTVGKTDYAGNSGVDYEGKDGARGPATLEIADGMNDSTWASAYGKDCNGVFHSRSQTTIAMITDGTSNTYLIGEKYLDQDQYTSGLFGSDDQGWDCGWDWDTVRWTGHTPFDPNGSNAAYFRPKQDAPGDSTNGFAFGSLPRQRF